MKDKPRWPYAEGMRVAGEIVIALVSCCDRIIIAGSLRRKKVTVGDVEIVYIPKFQTRPDPQDMFRNIQVNLANEEILQLEALNILERRRNSKGNPMYGEKNKLMRHAKTGMPVDLFATTQESWHNYLVCRTGSSENNIRICNAAIAQNKKWHPYGSGYTYKGKVIPMHSEREVFEFVGLKYLEPEER